MYTDIEFSDHKLKRPPAHGGRLLLWLALPFAWIYLHGIFTHAPKWEEPRRCMVAVEMIHRSDFVVPRVMGEIYRNKPPLYDWLIAVAAGLDADRVTAGHGRAVSLIALAAVAALLALVGTGRGHETDWLPPVLVLSFALVLQNGRAGETDVLFCLLLTSAVVCFEVGRRRGSPWIQWTLSQALVGLGAMTKGLSPLLFYPPVLWLAFRRPATFRPRVLPMLAGVVAMAGVMALWLLPYSRLAPVADLQSRWLDEVLKLYVRPGWSGTLRHLATYPLMLVLVTAPWSFLVAALPRRERRALTAEVAGDPWIGLCWTVSLWIALVYLFVPGVRGRYLMPMLPFLAVCIAALVRAWERHPGPVVPTAALRVFTSRAMLWGLPLLGIATVAISGRDLLGAHSGALLEAVAVIAISAAVILRQRPAGSPGSPVLPFLLLGLVYAAVFVGVSETRHHLRHQPFIEAGRAMAARIDAGTPVVCDCHDASGRKVGFALMQALDRTLEDRDFPGPHYRVTHDDLPPTASAEPLHRAAGFTLWRVGPRTGDAAGLRLTPSEPSGIMRPTPK